MRKYTPSVRLLILSCFLYASACKQVNTETTQEEVTTQQPSLSYPALGNQVISQLYADVQNVDIIFYDLPISVNQDDAASAKNSALYVSPSPVEINANCKPVGRMTWMSEGSIIKEADFYIDSLCRYFIFMENNQPMAANAMQESGVQFFNSIISQVQARQK